MASYNTIRTAESQPIGSIVPWVGSLTKIPKGWLLCNAAELNANEYPLLARIIRDTYGGQDFSGTFPNYSGTFKLPSVNQKALADISLNYFTATTSNQPTLNIDTVAAKNVLLQYIGEEGDLGPAQTYNAVTDMNFTYTPDPDGIITSFSFTGTAPTATTSTLYSNVAATSGTGVLGTGATFNVVKNTDQTYTVALKQKGSGYKVSDTLTINYTLIGGTSSANNITITINSVGNGFFGGTITGNGGGPLQFIKGYGIKDVYVIPRKLGRNHFPGHLHTGSYATTNVADSSSTPGAGVGVYDNPSVTLYEAWFSLYPKPPLAARVIQPVSKIHTANTWGNSLTEGEVEVTLPFESGVGRYTIGAAKGTKPARTHTAVTSSSGAHGVGKSWFTDAKNLRDGLGATTPGDAALSDLKSTGKIKAGRTIPFSDDSNLNYFINYDDGPAGGEGSDLQQTYTKVLFNNAAVSFTKTTRTNTVVNDVIQSHNHEGSFSVNYDPGSLSLPTSISGLAAPNVIPDNVPSAFQITFTVPTPSLAITNLIRAY